MPLYGDTVTTAEIIAAGGLVESDVSLGGNATSDTGKVAGYNASGYLFAPGYLLYDTFQVPSDATPLTTHVGERANWQQIAALGASIRIARASSGNCSLRGNGAGEGYYSAAQAPLSPDYSVTGVFKLLSDDNSSAIGIGLRLDYVGANGYFVRYNTSGNAWELCEVTSGVSAVLGSYTQVLTVNQLYTGRLRGNGTSLVFSVDGPEGGA